MLYEEIRTKTNLSYISVCSLSFLYNSKFILMATSLGTNAIVVTRVHSIYILRQTFRINHFSEGAWCADRQKGCLKICLLCKQSVSWCAERQKGCLKRCLFCKQSVSFPVNPFSSAEFPAVCNYSNDSFSWNIHPLIFAGV